MRLNPDATFDCLFIASRLRHGPGFFTKAELHLFAYLSCLLWLYRERTLTEWGYSFVGTELGAPFSLEIDEAITELGNRGYVTRSREQLRIAEDAESQLNEFLGLSVNAERTKCLEAACSSTAAYSVGMVGSALAEEPELRRARAVPNNRPLLEDDARSQLYEQFDALRSALILEDDDLRVPAVVWLAALYRSHEAVET